jgi:hypothetical protein
MPVEQQQRWTVPGARTMDADPGTGVKVESLESREEGHG